MMIVMVMVVEVKLMMMEMMVVMVIWCMLELCVSRMLWGGSVRCIRHYSGCRHGVQRR